MKLPKVYRNRTSIVPCSLDEGLHPTSNPVVTFAIPALAFGPSLPIELSALREKVWPVSELAIGLACDLMPLKSTGLVAEALSLPEPGHDCVPDFVVSRNRLQLTGVYEQRPVAGMPL